MFIPKTDLLLNDAAVVSDSLTSALPVTVTGGRLTLDSIVAPELRLFNQAMLTCLPSTADQMHKLEIEIAGLLTVSTNSRIDVSGKGYVAGRTAGNVSEGAASGTSGGSYGGLGGVGGFSNGNGLPNAVYGDYAQPEDWGSGGGPGGSSGGGRMHLQAQRLQLEGGLVADAAEASIVGSGGSILVVVEELAGAGWIRAAGKNGGTYFGWPAASSGGGSGGGRIAVYARDYSSFGLTNITSPGGLGGTQALPGGAGTVHTAQGRPHTHVRSFKPTGRNNGLVGNELSHDC